MARPIKFGLDYFPLNVSMDDKVELIEARHDLIGFAVVIKLLQKIYANGYFINVSEESIIVFSKRVNVDINKVNVIINDCVRYGIFDEERYKKYNILTSHGIQIRFIEATCRRKSVELIKEYLVNVDIKSLNDSIYIVNDYKSTQSKVKDSKVDESKTPKADIGDDVNEIYGLYPTTCPTKKTSTGKSKTDKDKIKILLKSKTKQELTETIDRYVKDCTKNKTYMKNFATFLNNLPDYSTEQAKTDIPVNRRVHYNMFGQSQKHYEKAYLENLKSYGSEQVQFLNYID